MKKKPRRKNGIAKALRTPRYKMRVEYTAKQKSALRKKVKDDIKRFIRDFENILKDLE